MSEDLYMIIYNVIDCQFGNIIHNNLIDKCTEELIKALKRDLLILKKFIEEEVLDERTKI